MHVALLALLLGALTPLPAWAQPSTSPSALPAKGTLSPSEARAERARTDAQLRILDARARSFKMGTPLALTIASATILTAAFVGLALSGYVAALASDGAPDDQRQSDKLRMRIFGGAIPVSGVALIVSWSALMNRVQARNAIRHEAKKLRNERQLLGLVVAPEVGPTRYALSLTAHF
jgi:hypothetical protein